MGVAMAMEGTRVALLRAMLDHAFAVSAWQVAGLTDDEYLSRPVGSAWGVARRDETRPEWRCGLGEWVIEDTWRHPDPLPMTSIGWRLGHISGWTEVYRNFTFGPGGLSYAEVEIPGTADAALARLARCQSDFREDVAALSDADLDALRPTHWGGEATIGALVWTIANEHLSHGSEIGALRDVYRGHARSDRIPEPIGFWTP